MIHCLIEYSPISVNSAYYKRNSSLTREARVARDRFHDALSEYSDQFLAFNSSLPAFLDKGYGLCLEFTHHVPKGLFWTCEGHISLRAGDVSNYTKVQQDFLFSSRYIGRRTVNDNEYQIIRADDKYIVKNIDTKKPSNKKSWHLEIKISLVGPEDLV